MRLNHCYQGDCRSVMQELISSGAAGKVQTIVTSPPYWQLRDYGVPGQLGQEATLLEFIANMVTVFSYCWDLLADDGTLWINMGDSYNSGASGSLRGSTLSGGLSNQAMSNRSEVRKKSTPKSRGGLKPKDIVGQPWRLAFALQEFGWYLRQDIIWHKPNPMPESVRDRCTKSHEYIFLLSKSERYYFDQEAILEPVSPNTHARLSQDVMNQIGSARAHGGARTNGNMKAVARKKVPAGWATDTDRTEEKLGRYTEKRKSYTGNGVGFGHGTDNKERTRGRVKDNASFDSALALPVLERNKRSVWTISTESFSGAHFATFPQDLVIPCILAGSRPGDLVFDPFMGSGTVAQVAQNLGRKWIGSELNPEYIELQQNRVKQFGLELHV